MTYSSSPADLDADLDLALSMADAADRVSMARFRALDLTVENKADLSPVTDADRGIETDIRATLAARRPDDAILGEEYGLVGTGARRWVVDPVDGTKNFVRGVPVWATLIALLDGAEGPSGNGHVVVGVVSAPALGRRWWARRGGGAWTTALGAAPRRLQVSTVASLSDAFFAYSGAGSWAEAGRGAHFESLGRAVGRTRGFGDFWAHMLVAEGAVDLSAEPEVSLWDLAALQVIVEEAGGRFTDLDHGVARPDRGSVLCSNGLLHDEARRLLSGPQPG